MVCSSVCASELADSGEPYPFGGNGALRCPEKPCKQSRDFLFPIKIKIGVIPSDLSPTKTLPAWILGASKAKVVVDTH